MIPLGSPEISDAGIKHVTDLLEEGLLSTGEVVAKFEQRFSSFVSRECGVAVASGSVALELALEAAFEEGDVVALSPYNCGSMLYSVQRVGLDPIFVDVDSETAALAPEELHRLNESIDGVLLSHLFGHPAHVGEIGSACDALDAILINDFAQAPGATFHSKPIGSVGCIGICSFGATKNLTTAEGGIVVTDDETVAEYVTEHRSNTHDVSPPPRSVRMNDIEAAIGLSQLATYEKKLDRKRAVAEVYRQKLADKDINLLSEQPWASNVYHAFPVLHPRADALAKHLRQRDIETSRLYKTPLHKYRTAPSDTGTYPVAERFANEVVLLPIHAQISDSQAQAIADTVNGFLANQ